MVETILVLPQKLISIGFLISAPEGHGQLDESTKMNASLWLAALQTPANNVSNSVGSWKAGNTWCTFWIILILLVMLIDLDVTLSQNIAPQ